MPYLKTGYVEKSYTADVQEVLDFLGIPHSEGATVHVSVNVPPVPGRNQVLEQKRRDPEYRTPDLLSRLSITVREPAT